MVPRLVGTGPGLDSTRIYPGRAGLLAAARRLRWRAGSDVFLIGSRGDSHHRH
jgi:hypothetical protein